MTAPVPQSVSSGLQSGFARHRSQEETVVFIVCREALRLLTATILKDAQTTTLAPGGHEPQGSLSSFEVNPHVSLSRDDTAMLRFAEAQNVHA